MCLSKIQNSKNQTREKNASIHTSSRVCCFVVGTVVPKGIIMSMFTWVCIGLYLWLGVHGHNGERSYTWELPKNSVAVLKRERSPPKGVSSDQRVQSHSAKNHYIQHNPLYNSNFDPPDCDEYYEILPISDSAAKCTGDKCVRVSEATQRDFQLPFIVIVPQIYCKCDEYDDHICTCGETNDETTVKEPEKLTVESYFMLFVVIGFGTAEIMVFVVLVLFNESTKNQTYVNRNNYIKRIKVTKVVSGCSGG